MSIRYDRFRASETNGPLIFFNDPMSEGLVANEINKAIDYGLCCFAYRKPNDTIINVGISEHFYEGVHPEGFVIGQFNPSLPYCTIPFHADNTKDYKQKNNNGFQFPSESTTKNEYKKEIEDAKLIIGENTEKKIVAARCLLIPKRVNIGLTFTELNKKYSDAFVFCFSTPATGCWAGASPELLIEAQGEYSQTMSLAGTRPSNANAEWDNKNILEQKIVTDFIVETLNAYGLDPVAQKSETLRAGKVEHLYTRINFSSIPDLQSLLAILKDLAPTPALCGFPKKESIKFIESHEKFNRGCYGGFCGPLNSIDNLRFNVILRCGSFTSEKAALFAGGGVTCYSNPEIEWEETENKLKTMYESLIFGFSEVNDDVF